MTDSKRRAAPYVRICSFEFTLDGLRAALATQGLHVVTAADKAVLDACAEEHTVPGVHPRFAYSAEAVARAELARRESAK